MMKALAACVLLAGAAAVSRPARADTLLAGDGLEPYSDVYSWRATPALVEWSTWFRLAVGTQTRPPPDSAARATMPPVLAAASTTAWDAALGIEGSLRVHGHVRVGAWAELTGLDGVDGYAGAEVVVTQAPRHVDMFLYDGEGVLLVRAGVARTRAEASIAYGYRCPWKLWGRYSRTTRYEIGARLVLTATRSYTDPRDWSATLGLEVEPVGALRYLLGIRSLY